MKYKFKYIGDRDETYLFGYVFPANVAVEVDNSHAIQKLSNNSHFENVFEEVVKQLDKPKKRTPIKKKANA